MLGDAPGKPAAAAAPAARPLEGTPPADVEAGDGGSVVTYHEDQSLSPPNRDTPVGKPAKSAWLVLRQRLGDICDSFWWEAAYVFLGIVYATVTGVEVSLIWEYGIGSIAGLQGMSAFSASLLGVFFVECFIKTIAFGTAFLAVTRNIVDFALVIVSLGLEIAVCVLLFRTPSLAGVTGQVYVSSRIFRLLIIVSRHRRTRAFITSVRTDRLRGHDNLSNVERTLGILRDLDRSYPLRGMDRVQLMWCIDVIASQKLYTGFFIGPKGEPIRFKGVDDETAQWLVGNYSLSTLAQPAQAASQSAANDRSASPAALAESIQPRSPAIATAVPPQVRISHRDSDADSTPVLGRRHTLLSVLQQSGDSSSETLGRRMVSKSSYEDLTKDTADFDIGGSGKEGQGGSFHKRTDSRTFRMLLQPVKSASGLDGGEEGKGMGDRRQSGLVARSAVEGLTALDSAALKFPFGAGFDLDRFNKEVDEWTFDVFALNQSSHGYPLTPVLIAALRKNHLLESGITPAAAIRLAQELEQGYDVSLPYHNRMHAADVVQCINHVLNHKLLHEALTPLDRFCLLIAGAIHDYKHPGVNNAFLVATGHPTAVRYNDVSVLENMHVASAFELMRSDPSLDVLAELPAAARAEARDSIIQMVLATDMKLHFEVLNGFRTQVLQLPAPPDKVHDPIALWFGTDLVLDPNESFKSAGSMTNVMYPIDYRRVILKATLHVADVSNPSRPTAICTRWADMVQEEFFAQGDKEAERGLPISMFMDRSKPAFPKMQVGFIEFIVRPLLEAYWSWLRTFKPVAEPLLLANIEHWKSKQLETEQSAKPAAAPVVSPPDDSSPARRIRSMGLTNRMRSLARQASGGGGIHEERRSSPVTHGMEEQPLP